MVDHSPEVWERLGALVEARRRRLDFKQDDAKALSGSRIARATWSDVERGARTNYDARTLDGVEIALGWAPGSIEAILAGGEPVLAEQASTNPSEAAFAEKVGRLPEADRRYVEGIIDGLLRDQE